MRDQVVELAGHEECCRDFLLFDNLHELEWIPCIRQYDRRSLQDCSTKPYEKTGGMKQRRRSNGNVVFTQAQIFSRSNGRRTSRPVADEDRLGKPGGAARQRDRKSITFVQRNIRHLRGFTAHEIVDVRRAVKLCRLIQQDQLWRPLEFRQYRFDHRGELSFKNQDLCLGPV